jgi:hypothetical protein
MTPTALFVRKFDELETRCRSDDWYDALECGRLLRQLLADAEPLSVVANRDLRLKLRYDVNDWEFREGAPQGVVMYWVGDGLDPETAMPPSGFIRRNRIACSLDRFLAQTCLLVRDQSYSVLDIIKYAANTAGATHYTSLPDEEATRMRELDQRIKVGGQPSLCRQLPPISRITLRALRPLRDNLYAALAG